MSEPVKALAATKRTQPSNPSRFVMLPEVVITGTRPKFSEVSYTTNGQNISFKVETGSTIWGQKWEDGATDGEGKTTLSSGKINKPTNLGEVDSETHELITAVRYADGNSNLEATDTKKLSDLYWSRSNTETNNKFNNYINKNISGEVDPDIFNGTYLNIANPSSYNSKNKTYQMLEISTPDNYGGIFYNGAD